jgi:hypothetical protein
MEIWYLTKDSSAVPQADFFSPPPKHFCSPRQFPVNSEAVPSQFKGSSEAVVSGFFVR